MTFKGSLEDNKRTHGHYLKGMHNLFNVILYMHVKVIYVI